MNTDESNENFEEPQNLNENKVEQPAIARHGCLTAWLVLTIIANSITSLVYICLSNKFSYIPFTSLVILIISGLANILFSFMLLSWKRYGFYGFFITSIIILIVNINDGLSIGKSLIGLIGILMVYILLQLKKDGVTGWSYLK